MARRIQVHPTHARIVQLYCPTTDVTVDDFLFTPESSHRDILAAIRLRFPGRLHCAWPSDVNGEPIRTTDNSEWVGGQRIDGDPVSNFRNVYNGERILIAVGANERILPEPVRKVELYLGGEMGQGKFKAMTRQDRRQHLRILRRQEAIQRKNILRLTLPHADVLEELAKPRYTTAISNSIIEGNWKIAHASPMAEKTLGAWAILSSASCGQPWMIEDLAMAKIRTRWTTDKANLKESEVLEIIEKLYEEAGATGSVWNMAQRDTAEGEVEGGVEEMTPQGSEEVVVVHDGVD